MSRVGDYITTYTGKLMYPLDPRAEEIDINDIAHALANTCRFNGHCPKFYSVAQHSVLVSSLVKRGNKLQALLHDASEAYLSDVPRPVKRSMPEYRNLEHNLQQVIYKKFGVQLEESDELKYIDKHIVSNEARVLWSPYIPEWTENLDPIPDLRFGPWDAKLSEEIFLNAYKAFSSSGW